MDYENPGQLAPGPTAARYRQELQTMKQLGIRPLILLNANSEAPTPSQPLAVDLVAPAAAGTRQIDVSPTTAAQIVPGRSGLNGQLQAQYLFTAVGPGGVVTLSQPLGSALAAGEHSGATLRFAPFGPPTLPNGAPNPTFAATMNGWLAYVGGITTWVRSILGDTDFDVEIWNELSFGSQFLFDDSYYKPAPAGEESDITSTLLGRTVAYLRQRSLGLQGVGITDGFASETPFAAPSRTPSGLTALSKHPYHGLTIYPQGQVINSLRSLGALGQPDYRGGATFADNAYDRFIPHYSALFPEYFLTALQTETLIRDLSPTTTKISGVWHGRYATGPDGKPRALWITEMNVDLGGSDLTVPGSNNPPPNLDTADVMHILARTTLRTYCAYINKGAPRVYMFATTGGDLGLVSTQFLDAAATGKALPSSGGPVMDSLRRFVATLSGAQTITHPRPLRLEQVADVDQDIQFKGDGTAAQPSLYNRDVLAVLPFQLTAHSWIVPTYVMTRDVVRAYRGGSSPTRFDLPDEPFRLVVGGVDASAARVSLYDPVANRSVPAHVVARSGNRVTIELLETDSPRMLKITD
jgi:hypothetical protein